MYRATWLTGSVTAITGLGWNDWGTWGWPLSHCPATELWDELAADLQLDDVKTIFVKTFWFKDKHLGASACSTRHVFAQLQIFHLDWIIPLAGQEQVRNLKRGPPPNPAAQIATEASVSYWILLLLMLKVIYEPQNMKNRQDVNIGNRHMESIKPCYLWCIQEQLCSDVKKRSHTVIWSRIRYSGSLGSVPTVASALLTPALSSWIILWWDILGKQKVQQ